LRRERFDDAIVEARIIYHRGFVQGQDQNYKALVTNVNLKGQDQLAGKSWAAANPRDGNEPS
jgi:hypothetical protein